MGKQFRPVTFGRKTKTPRISLADGRAMQNSPLFSDSVRKMSAHYYAPLHNPPIESIHPAQRAIPIALLLSPLLKGTQSINS